MTLNIIQNSLEKMETNRTFPVVVLSSYSTGFRVPKTCGTKLLETLLDGLLSVLIVRSLYQILYELCSKIDLRMDLKIVHGMNYTIDIT